MTEELGIDQAIEVIRAELTAVMVEERNIILGRVATKQQVASVSLEIGKLTGELYAKVQALEVKHNTEIARLEETVNNLAGSVLEATKTTEAILQNIRARLDGHDLAFVPQGLDEESKEKLARMLRREPKPIIFESDWQSYVREEEVDVREDKPSQGSCDDAIGPDQEGTDGSSTPTETGG